MWTRALRVPVSARAEDASVRARLDLPQGIRARAA
jgi:hypothetical protein